MSISKVRVGVATAEVGLGDAVLRRAGEAQLLLEDGLSVRARDTVETVEEGLEVGVVLEELLDQVEVEDLLHQFQIIGGAVHNLDLEVSVRLSANGGDVDVWDIGDLVGGEGLRSFVDLVGDALWGGTSVR